MATIESITPMLKVTTSGVFSIKDLLALIRKWCEKHNFDIVEKDQAESQGRDAKDYIIAMGASRDENDYCESSIKIKIIGQGITSVKRKDQMCAKGKMTIILKGILKRDGSNKWESSFMEHFFRTLWDRYVNGPNYKEFHQELTAEVKELHGEIKAFFNIEAQKIS